MKNMFYFILLFLQQILLGQEMLFNKDSLLIISNVPEGFTEKVEFTYSDTL